MQRVLTNAVKQVRLTGVARVQTREQHGSAVVGIHVKHIGLA